MYQDSPVHFEPFRPLPIRCEDCNGSPGTARIAAAERILIDNGVDPAKAKSVLQSIRRALIDEELYSD